jgi:8-oxo-dGTP pyrophosphatase MutT (NUDIX family)
VTEDPVPAYRPIFRLGGSYAEQAGDYLAGRRAAAEPRDAASVLLLRAAPDRPGVEVYMLRRARSMAFAPGASAFPGGSVDPRDAEDEVAWAGPDAADWGRLLDAPPALARALVCAAVRETFEESGVLLAGPAAGTLVADTSGPDWEADRTALLDRSLSLAQLLARRGLVLRSDLLRPWARWITPVTEARRYDTRFFAAELPPGQRTRDVGGEAEQVAWTRPAEAIRAARARELFLLPPTAACLAGLAGYPDVTAALGAGHSMRPVIPAVVQVDGTFWLTVPEDVGYPL